MGGSLAMPILPRLYAIADHDTSQRRGSDLPALAEGLHAAGVKLVQLRHKQGSPQETLAEAAVLRRVFGADARLIMNDRTDLALLAGLDGVHLGQDDLPPDAARTIFPRGLIGVSTHTLEQVSAAEAGPADYIAVGPVFATGTKLDASPVVGLPFLKRARELTAKPIVAIGGITRQNARSVIEAGADSVAVISALFAPGETVEQTARDFLSILR